MKNLAEKGILVNLKISHWSGRKHDPKIERDIDTQHQTKNAGKYQKNLISDIQLREIQSCAGELRRFVYQNSMPWGDNGDRLLPAKHYLDFCTKFQDLKIAFDQSVDVFLDAYPGLIEEAKVKLNGMFRPGDYPTIEKMRRKFGLELSCLPIAELDDFRLQVDDHELQKLRDQMQGDYTRRIVQATKDIWNRINETVSHMADTLAQEKPRIFDSLVTNIKDLIELLPQLNITDDPEITRAVGAMTALVVDADSLRNDEALRSQKAHEAQTLLQRFEEYMN